MRARNIKPGFYRDAELSDCSIQARYIVPGLWMMADREGRLKDKPKQIKMELCPIDNIDINELLEELARVGHILRYQVDGENYIQIRNFSKHQNPHKNEPSSEIPAPQDKSCNIESCHEHSSNGETNPADSLIADSGLLTADEERDSLQSEDSQSSPSAKDAVHASNFSTNGVPIQKIVDCWNEIMEKHQSPMPRVSQVKKDSKRYKHLRARWKEYPDLETWKYIFEKAAQSDFLNGRIKNFQASFNWLVKSWDHFQNTYEGQYDNKEQNNDGLLF